MKKALTIFSIIAVLMIASVAMAGGWGGQEQDLYLNQSLTQTPTKIDGSQEMGMEQFQSKPGTSQSQSAGQLQGINLFQNYNSNSKGTTSNSGASFIQVQFATQTQSTTVSKGCRPSNRD